MHFLCLHGMGTNSQVSSSAFALSSYLSGVQQISQLHLHCASYDLDHEDTMAHSHNVQRREYTDHAKSPSLDFRNADRLTFLPNMFSLYWLTSSSRFTIRTW